VIGELDLLERKVDAFKPSLQSKKQSLEGVEELVDLQSIRKPLLKARMELQTRASQRITALGMMGSGKSTTLNLMLSATIIQIDEYVDLFRRLMPTGYPEVVPDMFKWKYFNDDREVRILESQPTILKYCIIVLTFIDEFMFSSQVPLNTSSVFK
jgi:hypothetical protein